MTDTGINYGPKVASSNILHYVVETKFPASKFGKPSNRKGDKELRWGRHSPSAWSDKREPSKKKFFSSVIGNFEEKHPDVAGHDSRVADRYGNISEMAPTFTNADAALAYAARLAEYGECGARFSDGGTQESRDLEYLARPIPTRVVEVMSASLERVVEWAANGILNDEAQARAA